ncbi:MAG: flagellar filament capping protein FliD [Phycisphaeraceae bacterium]
MGQITSGIGLISGINTAQLIEQLLAIEARPKALVQRRSAILTSQQVAFQDVNAKLLALKGSVSGFLSATGFKATAATSSDDKILSATSSASAVPGTYNFTVSRLVSSQQTITKGFADKDATAIAPTGGTLTFEFGDARLDSDSNLSNFNGGAGITRGKIRIIDRSGASAVIDLSRATKASDILDAINSSDGINVTASVDGDGFVLTDNTGLTTTNLSVSDVNNSGTAATLGLNIAAVGDTLTAAAVNTVGNDTSLAALNDGNGVRRKSAQPDFQITTRDGSVFAISVGSAATLGQLADAINTATAGAVTLTGSGASVQLTDNTAGGTTFEVTALSSSKAAEDLGILTSDGNGDGIITGSRVQANINSRLLKHLNGGTGVGLGTISITNRSGAATAVDLSTAVSINDVVSLINAAGAGVTASLNQAKNGLKLSDTTGAIASDLIISDVSGTAAADLGLDGSFAKSSVDSGNLQFQYVNDGTRLASLRGGLGVAQGKFIIRDSNGATSTVDLTQGNEVTIGDVLAEINSRGLAINARVNDNGDGILIEDLGGGAVPLKISEEGSTTARDLGLLGEATNPGDHINGSFEKTVAIEATDTLQQINDKINAAGLNVTASIINDGSPANPFRLSLAAKTAGKGGAFVFDDGGTGLGAVNFSEARNALVFFGSENPAQAIAIASATNTISSVVPGVTIGLKNPSTTPVTLSVTRDDKAVVDSVKKFVEGFNAVVTTIKKYDNFNKETEERGLLLGDSSLSRIQSSLYRLLNNRNTDLTGQFNSLAQVGIKVGSGAVLQFDEAKFRAALETDPAAVQAMFTFKETELNAKGETVTKAAGIGVRIDELLGTLTDSVVQSKLDQLGDQITLNTKRIANLDKALEAKRGRLEAQFVAMEKALALLQDQSSSLTALSNLASQASVFRSNR